MLVAFCVVCVVEAVAVVVEEWTIGSAPRQMFEVLCFLFCVGYVEVWQFAETKCGC